MHRFALLAPLVLLGSCAVGPNFVPPAAPGPEASYASDGGGKAALGEGPDREWWKAFQSEDLDALVARALERNHSLEASRETLKAAQERIKAMVGKTRPQVDAHGEVSYQQVNLNAIGLGSSFNVPGFENFRITNPEFDLYTLGGGVSYDLDLFGRNRRGVERAAAMAEATARETEAAHLVIAARVVAQVLAIAALNDRIATMQTLLSEDERNVTLTEARRRGGIGTMVEVLSAQGELARDRAGLPNLEQQLAEGRAMLAVLLGISPGELGPTAYTLDQFALPGQVPVALPSSLVHRRPDIMQAEARLHAATAAVGIATAELYPNMTIGASVTQSTSNADKIFSNRFNAFDLFAGVTAPIFHGGTLRANKRAAEAEARAAAASYRQVVLDAFGQVSGLLSAFETDGKALSARQYSADIAERSLNLSRRSFQVGNSGILQVLDASRSYQQAKLALLDTKAQQFHNIARMYAATAGGWVGDSSNRTEEVAQLEP
jgi:NodT family efflux transporter outer membrane factor (OMF) lipoprotein